MLLNNKDIKRIKNKKVTYVKKFTQNLSNYNFDILASLIDDYSLTVVNKSNLVNFNATWQVKDVHKTNAHFFVFLDTALANQYCQHCKILRKILRCKLLKF